MSKAFLLASLCLFGWAVACPGLPFCRECTKSSSTADKICKTCNFSFFDEGSKSCVTKVESAVDHCIEYHKEGDARVVCIACDFGYHLTSEYKCFPCSEKLCAVCSNDNKCEACSLGLQVKDGRCEDKNKCSISQCEVCHTSNQGKDFTCLMCVPGFALNKHGECIASAQNCQVADPEEAKLCQRCRSGFFLNKDLLCVKNDGNHSSGSGVWGWILFFLLLGGVAVLFYMRNQRRGTAYKRVNNPEEYVTVG